MSAVIPIGLRSPSNHQADGARPHRSPRTHTTSNGPLPSPRRSMSYFEQGHLPHPPASRRTDSRDGATHANTESRREVPAHTRTSSRYTEQAAPGGHANGTPATEHSRSTTTASHNPPNLRRRTTIDATTGHWELGKTIGAGSMGKVKLARNKETGELVAVKIVPRQSSDGEHRTQAERERADHSKEIRTAREAAIVTLVDHPYICGMRDVVRTNYHWYMLFEYVNGGQMLDYIISHGKLKEKQARKFGRQIASALDYGHRNSIVHRDLKIENILISKSGDIKIIDYGLSNLFSPRSHLKTFCGSLYFAAPELLNAKQYTGPEVDVWSFGIVLYVLVCGKVPFDDQSMPQLHAKIKKGFVEYPPWLTPECKHLISRMLNTNPAERATLHEIMNHGWLNKGFNGPPDSYLPSRKPLNLPLDQAVIEKMTGFDFGPADMITTHLTNIIESEDYQRAIREADRRNAQAPVDPEKKRGVFDFYKRRNSINSRDTLNTPSSEAIPLGRDPVNAFHPLISIYYLAREKQEREAREKNPGGLSMPQSPGEKPLKVPDLPTAPEAAYTNSQAYEMAGEKPTGGRMRPRARTQGEDEVQQGINNLNVSNAPNPTIVEPEQQTATPPHKETTAIDLMRRLSARRHRDRGDREQGDQGEKVPRRSSSVKAVFGPGPLRRNLSVLRTRHATQAPLRPDTAQPTVSQDENERARFKATIPIHGLGRSISVNSSDVRRRFTRRGISDGSSARPTLSSSGSYHEKPAAGSLRQEAASDAETEQRTASRIPPASHTRGQSMQVRHIRRASMRTSNVPEETDAELQDDTEGGNDGAEESPGIKPSFLRGIFSVSTTSSRPLPIVRADIIRVLQQLGVEYKVIKNGFSCRHTPSIKANPGTDEPVPPQTPSGNIHQRRISFGRLRTTERDDFRRSVHAKASPEPSLPTAPPLTNPNPLVQQASEDDSDGEDENENEGELTPLPPRPTFSTPASNNYAQQQQQLPSSSAAAGETTTHVQSDLGEHMALRFEILLVKIPFLSLHGIQFKKVDGGTWQYKNMAQTILKELKL